MASISKDKQGNRRILFVDADGVRKTVYLGKTPARAADNIKTRVEHIVAAKKAGIPWDGPTAEWVANLGDELADKLARHGLIPKRSKTNADTLGAFLESYISSRAITKPNTARNYGQTRRYLVEHFGEQKALREITPGDADRFKEALLKAGLSQATVSREVKRARQFFRQAVRDKRIAENPFAEVTGGKQENETRFHYVTREEVRKVLEACPDYEWRLIFALARYGGLRCPSEHLALKWTDMDWARNRIRVDAPKTGLRWVPMFAELRPYLDEAWDEAPKGAVYVIQRSRDGNANWRTQLERIIERAGLEPWPKLFQNCRSTRETELMETFPAHAVCKWIGNSEAVARKHYLQVTDEHFERAAKGNAEATQNPTQYGPELARDGLSKKQQTLVFSGEHEGFQLCTSVQIPPRGVEPLSSD